MCVFRKRRCSARFGITVGVFRFPQFVFGYVTITPYVPPLPQADSVLVATNNNIYEQQLGGHPVAVVILHV